MFRKILILVLFSFLSIVQAQEENVKVYTIEIDVASTKSDGKSWDISGGAPDIKVTIDGEALQFRSKCRDKYRCSMKFFTTSTNDEWYFEIYDKDFANNDLIGKGDCGADKSCKLGLAKIKIVEQ